MENIYVLEGSLKNFLNDFRKEQIIDAINEFSETLEKEGFVPGEIELQTDNSICLSNISHKVLEVTVDDDLSYKVKIEVLVSDGYKKYGVVSTSGDKLKMLLDAGIGRPTFRGDSDENLSKLMVITFDVM